MTLLSTHTVYRGLLWSVGLARAHARLRARVLRVDLPVRHAAPLLRVDLARPATGAGQRGSRRTRRTPTSARSTTSSTLSSSPRVAGSAIGGLFDPICIAVRVDRPRRDPGRAVHRARGARRARRTSHSRPLQAAADRTQDFLAQTVWQSHAVLLPPDVAHRLALRRAPLREPLHPAVLVPRPLPARRVPRRLLALRALRHGEGPRQVHRLQPLPRALPGRRLARRAA